MLADVLWIWYQTGLCIASGMNLLQLEGGCWLSKYTTEQENAEVVLAMNGNMSSFPHPCVLAKHLYTWGLHVQIPHGEREKQIFTGIQFVNVEKLTEVNVSWDTMTIF